MRVPIAIPPGLRRDGTEGQSRGRWLRSSLVRGYGDDIGPVLGWRRRSESAVSGRARAIITWAPTADTRYIGIGTHTGLYVQSAAGTVYDITPSGFVAGEADGTVNVGFGGGFFGVNAYGTPRPDVGTPIPASVWSLGTWGADLVGCVASDGRLVEWKLNTATEAAVIPGAPTDCVGLVSTQDRFLIALGADGNPRGLAWCDQEDNTDWTPSPLNQAGDQELNTSGAIMTAVELRGQTLILTDLDAHVLQYIGPPFIFSTQRVGEGCGAISVGCAVDQGDWAVWWSTSGFWRFDGSVTPIDCPLKDLDASLNQGQRSKISGWHNAKWSEVWWHYPAASSLSCDRYIAWNYRENTWWEGASGNLARLCGAGPGVFSYPLLVSGGGYVYEHEVGSDLDGALPYARSGPITLGDGSSVMRVLGFVPDTVGTCRLGFFTRDYPTSTETELASAEMAAGRTDLRFTARQAEVQVEFSTIDGRFGIGFLEATPGGRR